MANRFAIANGNWSDTATWSITAGGAGGASVPVLGDTAYANNKSVTVDVDATCDAVRNDVNSSGATSGGLFTLANGVTLTASIFGSNTSNLTTVTYAGASPNSASIVGNIAPTSTTSVATNIGIVSHTGTGTLNITSASVTCLNSGGGGNYCIRNGGTGTMNLTMSAITIQQGGNLVSNASTGTLNITFGGVITAFNSVNSNAIFLNGAAGTLNGTGDLTNGGSQTGPLLGGNNAAGTITWVGKMTAVNGGHAVAPSSTQTLILSGSCIASPNGTAAVYHPKWRMSPAPTYAEIRYALNGTSTYTSMYTADNGFTQANVADVRSGTVYASGALVGTCAIPAASAVASQVPVDSGIGTALLTPSGVWDYLTADMTTSGSIGERLKNAATQGTLAAELAGAFPRT